MLIIIVGEPTGKLDKDTEVEILKIFKRLAKVENKCIIIVTHLQNVCVNSNIVYELKKYKKEAFMKKVKIIVDIIMFIIMILLMSTKTTGLQMHEILGIGIFVIFTIHKILNFKWIKSIGKNIFNKNMQTKSKVQFIFDVLLFIFITANVITGMLISKCILTKITISNIKLTTILHKFFAWWSLILISIHIGFHWKSVVNYVTSKFKSLKDNTFVKIILKVVYVVIAILGVISLLKKDVYTNLIPIIDNDNDLKKKHRDFEDINKSNSNEIVHEKRYKNRPNDLENPNLDNKKEGKNGNFNEKSDGSDDKENNSENDNNSVQTTMLANTTSGGGTPTLSEYLSKFTCSGCGKRCLLSSPKCGTERSYQTEKTQEYNQLYGNTESNTILDDNENLPGNNSNSTVTSKNDNMNEITKANINGISVIDYISIMGLLIGGTYYTIDIINIIDKKKKLNNNK